MNGGGHHRKNWHQNQKDADNHFSTLKGSHETQLYRLDRIKHIYTAQVMHALDLSRVCHHISAALANRSNMKDHGLMVTLSGIES